MSNDSKIIYSRAFSHHEKVKNDAEKLLKDIEEAKSRLSKLEEDFEEQQKKEKVAFKAMRKAKKALDKEKKCLEISAKLAKKEAYVKRCIMVCRKYEAEDEDDDDRLDTEGMTMDEIIAYAHEEHLDHLFEKYSDEQNLDSYDIEDYLQNHFGTDYYVFSEPEDCFGRSKDDANFQSCCHRLHSDHITVRDYQKLIPYDEVYTDMLLDTTSFEELCRSGSM